MDGNCCDTSCVTDSLLCYAARMQVELCFYCGIRLIRTGGKGKAARTKDHKQPRSRGGSWQSTNIVLACWPCNIEKGKLTVDEYRAVLAFRRGLLKVGKEMFRFAGEQSKFVAERSGVHQVIWEPKFILVA